MAGKTKAAPKDGFCFGSFPREGFGGQFRVAKLVEPGGIEPPTS
jgi:hypothetical protein